MLSAFGAAGAVDRLEPLGRGRAFRFDDVVFRRVADPAESAALAAIFEQLRVSDLRVARPVRASDGRWVVAGWSVQRFVAGRPEPRYDDIIATSVVLHEALADAAEPRFLKARTGLYSVADRLVFAADQDTAAPLLGEGHAARSYAELAAGRGPITAESQLIHGDLFGNVLFAGGAPPAVVDFAPYWRPASYAAAVIAVDALAWGGSQIDLLDRWSHLPDWPQVVRRALMFRLAVSMLHPRTTPSSLVEVLSVVELIRPFLS